MSLLSFAATCHLFSSQHTVDPTVRPQVDDPIVSDPVVRPQVDDPIVRPHHIMIPQVDDPIVRPQVAGLSHLFRRHVKPKKQHEIKHLGEVPPFSVNTFNIAIMGYI